MFSIDQRTQIHDRLLQMANADARVVAAAVVGSLALGEGDRWSDLDLTFAVADTFSIVDVLEDWTKRVIAEFDAVQLFDVTSGPSIYRVFLLPGCLQCDLSFTPASKFGAVGAKFRLLFGEAVEKPHYPPPSAQELFGQAVHHALRARVCIERGKLWQAEYWVSATRNHALSLACLRLGLPTNHGRGFDALPAEVRTAFLPAIATSLEQDELLRALRHAISGLLREAGAAHELATKVEPQLRELMEHWEDAVEKV